MNARQISLDLSQKKKRKKAGPHLARKMIAVLSVSKTWMKRKDFLNWIALTDRECRLGREAAHGRILAGQKGYKLLKYATPDEIREAGNMWISRVKANQEQYSQLMRRAHAMINRKVN